MGMKFKDAWAAKLELVHELLAPKLYDDCGNFIGYGKALITVEEALELLDFPLVSKDSTPPKL